MAQREEGRSGPATGVGPGPGLGPTLPSAALEDLLRALEGRDATLGELLERSQEHGFGLLLVLLSLPIVHPLPVGGLSSPLGVVILALGLQLLAGLHAPTLPEYLAMRRVPRGLLHALLRAGPPALRAVERLSRPRLALLVDPSLSRALTAAVVCLMAVSIIIPLPLTNAPPALAIVLMGLGMLMGDGLLVLAGWAVAVAAAVITSLVLYAVLHLGRAAGDSIVALLRSVLGR